MNHARGRRSAWPGDGIVDDHDLAAGTFSVLIPGKYYPPIRSWATVAGTEPAALEAAGAGYTGPGVTVDGQFVTANGPKSSAAFGERIAELLAGRPT